MDKKRYTSDVKHLTETVETSQWHLLEEVYTSYNERR
jgi:hypothetical protein